MPRSRAVHVPFPRLPESWEWLRERRLDVEIMFSAPVLDRLTDSDLDRTLATPGYTPRISVHAPFMDLSPAAVDPLVREVTLRRFRQVTRIARKFPVATIIFHSGYEKWKYHLHPEIWLERSAATWHDVLRELDDLPTCIAIENIFEDRPDNLVALAQRMDHPRFGLCFDSGHFNLFARLDLSEWLRQTSPHIFHLHLHDNDGTADRHQPPGEGTFPFIRLFEWFGSQLPPHTLEAHDREGMLKGLAALDTLLGPSGKET